MISVSLISYNSPEVTIRAIKSILIHLIKEVNEFEFIVVDNASTEDNVNLIREQFSDVKLIVLNENIGFARAHNLAIKSSQGEVIVIANSDVIICEEGVFNSIESKFQSHPEIGAIAPLIVDARGLPSPSSRDIMIYSLKSTMLSVLNSIFPMVNRDKASKMPKVIKNIVFSGHESAHPNFQSRYVRWVDGMFVAFRRDALIENGLFDEFYFFDHEIGDLLLRIARKYKIYYDASCKIMHLGGYSRSKNPKIIKSSILGYIHFIYNNKREYYRVISYEIIILSKMKSAMSKIRQRDEESKIWEEILQASSQYMKNPVMAASNTPSLEKISSTQRGSNYE
ncbi:glycosyltransferase [Deinococcus koreensis]|uniref:Glycosyltransferase 2-like domain-containing protein n=1 Tax=Deinococcus koreensis TaxID=2054903 RepID=A0A2K3UTW3_9DEIO|nr:glycosyltransferase [Deinococcus koreensis]PNY79950.1 hypothetical protein CVO96_18335 [Deinococcus koreensis]